MKKLLILLVLILGCAMPGCGLVHTPTERSRRISQAHKYQWRMMVDDWDYLWLNERNSRMTEFHPRVGI